MVTMGRNRHRAQALSARLCDGVVHGSSAAFVAGPAFVAGAAFVADRPLRTWSREKTITRGEVYIADEAFFTGTAAEVTPIRKADGRAIGNGARGPVTARLQALFFDAAHGRLQAHRDWLAQVGAVA